MGCCDALGLSPWASIHALSDFGDYLGGCGAVVVSPEIFQGIAPSGSDWRGDGLGITLVYWPHSRSVGGRHLDWTMHNPIQCHSRVVRHIRLGYNDAEVFVMRIESGRIAMGFSAMLLGLMVAVQFRLQQIVPPPTNNGQLLSLLKKSDLRRQQLTQEVAKLNAQLDAKLSQAAAARKLTNQLVATQILAGTIGVQGPGVTIQWSNGTAPSAYQLSDINLLLLVNELRAAGAEAIAINGQRITGLTEIRSAANYILINQTQEAAPFTITAIGAPSTLESALKLPGGLYDVSQQEGLNMTISHSSHIVIPAAPPTSLTSISSASTP